MTAKMAVTAYRWIYAFSIFALSLETFLAHQDIHIRALAGTEIVAVALFVIHKTRTVGLFGLLATYAWASALHVIAGDIPYRFAIYGGAAALVWFLERAPDSALINPANR